MTADISFLACIWWNGRECQWGVRCKWWWWHTLSSFIVCLFNATTLKWDESQPFRTPVEHLMARNGPNSISVFTFSHSQIKCYVSSAICIVKRQRNRFRDETINASNHFGDVKISCGNELHNVMEKQIYRSYDYGYGYGLLLTPDIVRGMVERIGIREPPVRWRRHAMCAEKSPKMLCVYECGTRRMIGWDWYNRTSTSTWCK